MVSGATHKIEDNPTFRRFREPDIPETSTFTLNGNFAVKIQKPTIDLNIPIRVYHRITHCSPLTNQSETSS